MKVIFNATVAIAALCTSCQASDEPAPVSAAKIVPETVAFVAPEGVVVYSNWNYGTSENDLKPYQLGAGERLNLILGSESKSVILNGEGEATTSFGVQSANTELSLAFIRADGSTFQSSVKLVSPAVILAPASESAVKPDDKVTVQWSGAEPSTADSLVLDCSNGAAPLNPASGKDTTSVSAAAGAGELTLDLAALKVPADCGTLRVRLDRTRVGSLHPSLGKADFLKDYPVVRSHAVASLTNLCIAGFCPTVLEVNLKVVP